MTNVYYKKGDDRIIRIEPNPYKVPATKFVIKTFKMNGAQVVTNGAQNPVTRYKEADKVYRIPGTTQTICPGVGKNNTIKTGLDVMVTNPFRDLKSYKSEWAERMLEGKDKAMLQYVLEYEFGYEQDYLNNRIVGVVPSTENMTFFQKPDCKPVLDGHVTLLNMSNPIQRIWYYTLLASDKVAKSMAALEFDPYKKYDWVITDEIEKEQVTASKIQRETTASYNLEDLKRSKSDAIIQMAKALEIDEAYDRNFSNEKAFNLIYNFYNVDNKNYKEFIENYELWKDGEKRSIFISKAELFDYIKSGVVSRRNGKYIYMRRAEDGKPSEQFMHKSKIDFIQKFMLDPVYQDEVELMEAEYMQKTR